MSLSQQFFSSILFQIGMLSFNRFIGIISTLILARLLVPKDFGLIAIIVIVIQLFETLSDSGTHHYLVQKTTLDHNDLNTAFTLDMILKGFLFILSIPLGYALANWYQLDSLWPALVVASLSMFIKTLKNPGYSLLIKELDYKQIFRLSLTQKTLSFIVTISWVMINPSYWAIIVGELTSAIILAIGSYVIHQYRPHFSLSKIKKQWLFSKWSLLRGITGFIRSHIDTIFVSRLFPQNQLGAYHLHRDIAVMPALMIINPIMEPLIALLAKSKNASERFAFQFRTSYLFLFFILLPLSGTLWNFSEGITQILLGEQWLAYHELLKYFSLLFITYSLFSLMADSFLASGKIKALFYFDLASTLFLVIGLLQLKTGDIIDFAWYRGILGTTITLAMMAYNNLINPYGIQRLLALCLPSITGIIFSQLFCSTLNEVQSQHLFSMIIDITLYLGIYGFTSLSIYGILYRYKGIPELQSIYQFLIQFIKKKRPA